MKILSIDVGLMNLGIAQIVFNKTPKLISHKTISPTDSKILKHGNNCIKLYKYFQEIMQRDEFLEAYDLILIEQQPAINTKNVRFEAIIYCSLLNAQIATEIILVSTKLKLFFIPKRYNLSTYYRRKKISKCFCENLFKEEFNADDADATMHILGYLIKNKLLDISYFDETFENLIF